ncbi:Ig-like domain-containing protein [Hufsiella ginkgonis]|uniref:SbsA Ig-like domain-containing protein n=1 Tax=Hufsiella ginkgonis TaxID=2695274 RepID=A0A7K1Y3R7_9SPHI|nr:Ig-like domain-containing protein [Hufsiella ginkgonis]MXV17882.1 hypothetical protein [Hufsiella ginkgonis]
MHFCSCTKQGGLGFRWQNGKAVAIIIPAHLVTGYPDADTVLRVKLVTGSPVEPMLGTVINAGGGNITFQPLVPFSRGASYEVFYKERSIGILTVPGETVVSRPMVTAVYPSLDTLPENLLKFYFEFSAPMREGEALDHIALLNDKNEVLPDVFLHLQTELWDPSGTVLTVWLDPGRIKRELAPNQEMGNPLVRSRKYTLQVSGDWKDRHGKSLEKSFYKKFIAGARDDKTPDLAHWQLTLPAAGSVAPLEIVTDEPLDHFLLPESVVLITAGGRLLPGKLQVGKNDHSLTFIPREPWKKGTYRLDVNSRLEDLAGNNLNRLFDRDVTRDAKRNERYYEKRFVIR